MKVRHRMDMFGNSFTDCTYTLGKIPATARLIGHLTPSQATARLADFRKRDVRVIEEQSRGGGRH
mgnify:CR=1 FL=1